MRPLDVWLQNWRARRARPWVRTGSRVLDIGCHQGEFLEVLGDRIAHGVGIDPVATPRSSPRYEIFCRAFPDPTLLDRSFDVVTMLAVVEHVQALDTLIAQCRRVLVPGGRVVLTVPSPIVDRILGWLVRLRIADAMSLEQHHGFDPRTLPEAFRGHGFALERWDRFQLGCNNLMVFRSP